MIISLMNVPVELVDLSLHCVGFSQIFAFRQTLLLAEIFSEWDLEVNHFSLHSDGF